MQSLLALFALLPLIAAAVCAAPNPCNPLLPPTYTYTAITAARAQTDSLARKAINKLLSYPNSAKGAFGKNGGWTAQNGWTNIADYDRLRGSKVFATQVSSAQDALSKHAGQGVPFVNEFNDDNGWAALANLRAYEAYGDKKYLNWAIGIWEYTNKQMITQKVLDKGYLEGTKVPEAKTPRECGGKTMLGGVHWVNGLPDYPNRAKETGVNAVSTGLFSLLSAELCGITGDKSKYCTKAYLAAQWLDNHMVSPEGLVWDNIDNCKVTEWIFTYNAGLYIGTYATLAGVTGNATALSLAERTTKAALKHKNWHADNGVIKEGSGPAAESNDGIGFKSVLVRALYRSYKYFKNEQLKSAVLEYINIQYYGLTQLASNSRTEPVEYGRSWPGPFEVSTAHSQLAALDVLNAITLNPNSAFFKTEIPWTPVSKELKRATGC